MNKHINDVILIISGVVLGISWTNALEGILFQKAGFLTGVPSLDWMIFIVLILYSVRIVHSYTLISYDVTFKDNFADFFTGFPGFLDFVAKIIVMILVGYVSFVWAKERIVSLFQFLIILLILNALNIFWESYVIYTRNRNRKLRAWFSQYRFNELMVASEIWFSIDIFTSLCILAAIINYNKLFSHNQITTTQWKGNLVALFIFLIYIWLADYAINAEYFFRRDKDDKLCPLSNSPSPRA